MTKTIKISDETHAELTGRMKWGETLDDAIQSLLHPSRRFKKKENEKEAA